MDILGFIKGELLEIIEFNDDSRDTLSWRFPDEDKAIKNGAKLVVRESQLAQFVYLGQFGDSFGPGTHTLVTDNIPVLTTLKGWKYGFQSPFKADVYYVTTRLFTGNKWGTANPVMMRDKDFGVVRLRAFGSFDFKIVDAPVFLTPLGRRVRRQRLGIGAAHGGEARGIAIGGHDQRHRLLRTRLGEREVGGEANGADRLVVGVAEDLDAAGLGFQGAADAFQQGGEGGLHYFDHGVEDQADGIPAQGPGGLIGLPCAEGSALIDHRDDRVSQVKQAHGAGQGEEEHQEQQQR